MYAQDEQVILCFVQKQHSICFMGLHVTSLLVVACSGYHVQLVSDFMSFWQNLSCCQYLEAVCCRHTQCRDDVQSCRLHLHANSHRADSGVHAACTEVPPCCSTSSACHLCGICFVDHCHDQGTPGHCCHVCHAKWPCSCISALCDASWLPAVHVVLVLAVQVEAMGCVCDCVHECDVDMMWIIILVGSHECNVIHVTVDQSLWVAS